jgi:hypothetical protein
MVHRKSDRGDKRQRDGRAAKSNRRPDGDHPGADVPTPGISGSESDGVGTEQPWRRIEEGKTELDLQHLRYNHLLGKPYVSGKQDCGTILKSFFFDNCGFEFTDYARPDDWWKHGMNLFYEIAKLEGFRPQDIPIDKMQVGDVMLMSYAGSRFPNHNGIYVGEGKIIQHFHGKLSNCERIRSHHRDALLAIMRRPDIIIKPLPEKELQLVDVLSPYWKQRLAKRLETGNDKELIEALKEKHPDAGAVEAFARTVGEIARPDGD